MCLSSCNKQAVENTEHFLLVCEKHKQLREKLFKTVSEKLNIQFVNMSCVDRLSILLSHSLVVNGTAKYAIEAYKYFYNLYNLINFYNLFKRNMSYKKLAQVKMYIQLVLHKPNRAGCVIYKSLCLFYTLHFNKYLLTYLLLL